MNRKNVILFGLLSGGLLAGTAAAAEIEPTSESMADRYASVYAARSMRRLDKNGDGKFVEAESPRDWKRCACLDKNKDGAFSPGTPLG